MGLTTCKRLHNVHLAPHLVVTCDFSDSVICASHGTTFEPFTTPAPRRRFTYTCSISAMIPNCAIAQRLKYVGCRNVTEQSAPTVLPMEQLLTRLPCPPPPIVDSPGPAAPPSSNSQLSQDVPLLRAYYVRLLGSYDLLVAKVVLPRGWT